MKLSIDLQEFVDNIEPMTCIMSVEMKPDGRYGDIRIVTGNKAYIKSIETAWEGPQMNTTKFVPNSVYQNYFPTDLNFEDICYRAAVLKQPVHTYVHPERFDFWFNIFLLPLRNEGNIFYCTYTQEVRKKADAGEMSNIPQETASAVLSTCIKLHGTDKFIKTIQGIIKDIRKMCDASTCAILTVNTDDRTCNVIAEDRSSTTRLQAMKQVLHSTDNFYDLVMSWEDTIGGSSSLIVKNENDMDYVREKNPGWHHSLTTSNVTSIVLFPLKDENGLLGYIWATNFDTARSAEIKEILELTTFFVSSSLSNYLLVKKLRVMSSVDMLTGVYNRNEMNNRIDRLISGEDHIRNLGIVFADLNGLKRVNDDKGHISGDQLLKNAADILTCVFPEGEVYRAGGDEFMVIMPDSSEKEILHRIEMIKRKDLGFGRASFAAGVCHVKDSSEILSALHIADERMYADKDEFYKKNPDLIR